jgi:dTDP-4-dehydrorhamnose 3,5-epimerase
VDGVATVGLCDLRDDSSSSGCAYSLRVTAATLALVIPPGVAHGFFFHTESAHLNGLSNEWEPDDDGRFHWADRSSGLHWPVATPIVSARDAAAPSLAHLLDSGWSLA